MKESSVGNLGAGVAWARVMKSACIVGVKMLYEMMMEVRFYYFFKFV